MVERYWNTEPIVRPQVLGANHEAAIIDDVDMAERCTFRGAGSAGGELDVDRLVGLEGRRDRIEYRRLTIATRIDHRVEIEHAGGGVAARSDDGL